MHPDREAMAKTIRALLRRGVSPEDAEDFVQSAYLRLSEQQAKGKVQAPSGFLYRTAMNLSIDDGRRKRRWSGSDRPVEDLPIADPAPLPDAVLEGRKRLEKLEAGFSALDERTRAIVKAQKLEMLSVAEIARREGLSVSAVEKRLRKGMLFLMTWMEE
ncbi:sigma-70 family RNA polymerase sigma factor [Pelagerythrobacter marensis]|uniref:Sigma-70 family RNA polymerase sigma factor n=1 Tax=Pelagerythrobacter marensis TaxID=543877 RepID=A0ABZ2D5T2_9SPHN